MKSIAVYNNIINDSAVLKVEMKVIWAEQVKHVACIQDPPGVQLYTMTGNMKKGRVTLPILRCARGSTSMESFHLHLARFVPGSSAGAVNFQAYILDGICRWNSARAAAAVQPPTTETLRTFNSRLQSRVNQLNQSVFGEVVFSCYQPPSKYTGEQFGVRYLYHQTGRSFTSTGDQLDVQIDEGFADVDQPAVTAPVVDQDEHLITVAPPVDPESEKEEEVLYMYYTNILHFLPQCIHLLYFSDPHMYFRMRPPMMMMTKMRQWTPEASLAGRKLIAWLGLYLS